MPQTIELPRRTRAGSVSDEEIAEFRTVFVSGKVEKGHAVIVEQGHKTEKAARNRARAVAVKYKSKYGENLRAHSVKMQGENGQPDTFVSAVSLAPPKDDDETTTPEGETQTDGATAADETPTSGQDAETQSDTESASSRSRRR